MLTVYKYELPSLPECSLNMPAHARILTVQVQDGIPCIWALVDTELRNVARHFAILGTGRDATSLVHATYIGTFQLPEARLVFHVFDLGER